MKVLTLVSSDNAIHEVHMLNPGDRFEGFGGPKGLLIPEKTASLVIRRRIFGSIDDTEYDIHDKNVWEWVARLINEDLEMKAQTE